MPTFDFELFRISYKDNVVLTYFYPTRFYKSTSNLNTIKDRELEFSIYSEYSGNRWRSEIPDAEIEEKPYLYTDKGSPGWITFNAKSSFQLNSLLTAQIGIENIFDVHYRTYSSGISAPGRNVIVSLRANF